LALEQLPKRYRSLPKHVHLSFSETLKPNGKDDKIKGGGFKGVICVDGESRANFALKGYKLPI
jgi:hypothetical protein